MTNEKKIPEECTNGYDSCCLPAEEDLLIRNTDKKIKIFRSYFSSPCMLSEVEDDEHCPKL